MIKINLESKNGKSDGCVKVEGSGEELVNEIYLILVTLSNQVPELFDLAVEKLLIEEEE